MPARRHRRRTRPHAGGVDRPGAAYGAEQKTFDSAESRGQAGELALRPAGLALRCGQVAKRKIGTALPSGSDTTSTLSSTSTCSVTARSKSKRPHHHGPSLNWAITTGCSTESLAPETL